MEKQFLFNLVSYLVDIEYVCILYNFYRRL